jgi:HK97 gp10 family phage protein
MAIKISFDVSGFDNLLKEFNRLGGNVEEAQEEALDIGAEIIKEELSNTAPASPIRKSHAKDHVKIKKSYRLREIGFQGKKYFYMKYPNDGTRKQAAQFFVEKANKSKGKEAMDASKEHIKKAMRR